MSHWIPAAEHETLSGNFAQLPGIVDFEGSDLKPRGSPMLTYEVFLEAEQPERWVAEAIDFDAGGVVYTVVFSGPDAERRAREYAEWKSRTVSGRAASTLASGAA